MKRIQIKVYPATFDFKIRTELPIFVNEEEYCEIRTKLLFKNLKKHKIYSYGHIYEDYAVTDVCLTEDGEIWEISS